MNKALVNYSQREDYRYYVSLRANFVSFGQKYPVKVIDVAKKGLRIFSKDELDKDVILEIETDSFGKIILVCENRWSMSHYHGLRILHKNDNWLKLMALYEEEFTVESIQIDQAA